MLFYSCSTYLVFQSTAVLTHIRRSNFARPAKIHVSLCNSRRMRFIFTCPKRICTDPEQGKSKKRKRRLGQQDEQKSRDYSGERVIAIDPGRVNIVYAEEKLENGSFKSYKLTRGEYYERCGMIRRNRKTAKWEKTIREEELMYSRHSPQTQVR